MLVPVAVVSWPLTATAVAERMEANLMMADVKMILCACPAPPPKTGYISEFSATILFLFWL